MTSNQISDFPRNEEPQIPLIAPLWVGFTAPLTVFHRVAEDAETLELVTQMVAQKNSEFSDYQPSLAVIVTMEEVDIALSEVVSFKIMTSRSIVTLLTHVLL